MVGAHVRAALAGEGSLSELVAADPVLGADAAALVRPGVGVRMRTSRGGAGPAALDLQSSRTGRCSPTSVRGSASDPVADRHLDRCLGRGSSVTPMSSHPNC